jgi:hypothetical protein
VHPLAGGGSESVDIDRCDSQHLMIVARSGFRLVRSGR